MIGLITEWRTASGDVEKRDDKSDLGGTMRLGLQEQRLKPGTLARELYARTWSPSAIATATSSTTATAPSWKMGLVIAGKSMDDTW